MKKQTLLTVLNLVVALCGVSFARAQGTAFTYQGKLIEDCCPATGYYDFVFKVYNSPDPGTPPNAQVGVTFPTNRVPVTNGLFTARLEFDNSGGTVSAVFTGARRWLQIEARTNNSPDGFVLLLPRAELTATPHAIYAGNAATLNGQNSSAFAPASGSSAYVAKAGDTMTGTLRLPANGLMAGANQLVLANGNVGIGTVNPSEKLQVAGNYLRVDCAAGQAAYMGNAGSFQGVSFGSLNPDIREIDFFNPNVPQGEVGFMNAVMNNLTAFGNITADRGVLGSSVTGDGVVGKASVQNRSGVYGEHAGNGGGVAGRAYGPNGVGVYAESVHPNGLSGLFDGRMRINGDVGIGTTPEWPLDIRGAQAVARFTSSAISTVRSLS